jgi:predicted nucleotidyltransferase
MNESDKILKTLKSLKKNISNKYKVNRIGLFGSYMRGEQTINSDIDILTNFKDDADLFDLVGLGQFLEEKLQQKVDIVPEDALRKELKNKILKEAVYI